MMQFPYLSLCSIYVSRMASGPGNILPGDHCMHISRYLIGIHSKMIKKMIENTSKAAKRAHCSPGEGRIAELMSVPLGVVDFFVPRGWEGIVGQVRVFEC